MPRTAREKSENGKYHIMLRGINQQTIFENEEDNEKFIDILEKYQKELYSETILLIRKATPTLNGKKAIASIHEKV
ncbi:hypothetical protein [Dehalobacterium formicoaceticum]|uniref:hypothetical protein n=1 Tax=Dehalobacterium formicoaceticum TaxID=51515 RepID=UPI0018DFA1D6|nr:hypothetical protein [Dehalobacterium formicoaceticum]